ncbi:MAG TPA: hypothetical protein DCQ06_12170 [Myxococcales bacterium]|nr:hypothetical protein [Myxococcales bacterium]
MGSMSRNLLIIAMFVMLGCDGRKGRLDVQRPDFPMMIQTHQETVTVIGDWNVSELSRVLGTLPMGLKKLNHLKTDRISSGATLRIVAPKERIEALRRAMRTRQASQKRRVKRQSLSKKSSKRAQNRRNKRTKASSRLGNK